MLPDEPRTVKPRKPSGHAWLPIIVASREHRTIYCEMTGSVHGWDERFMIFRAHPSAMVVAPNMAFLLAELNTVFQDNPMWQYRVSPVKRDAYNPNPATRTRTTADTIVTYFGWKGTSYATKTGKKANRKGHWHYPIDPNLFTQSLLRSLVDSTGTTRLYDWGRDLREWCHANNLHPSPTAGGLGGQLLRDERFYPEARRKIPRATNNRVRPLLPGNYYKLLIPEHKAVKHATYIDMSSAHHHIASYLEFPCANHLYARGHFKETTETVVKQRELWAPNGTTRYDNIIRSHGLFRLQINVPTLKPNRFPLPYLEKSGRVQTYVYSNEMPTLRHLGVDIEGISAAWTSYQTETGLNRYGAWAITETATMTPARKGWAKSVLLATYGNLAARSRVQEFGYRTADAGVTREYPAGPLTLPAKAHVSDTEQEVPTVNIIHRGMIEAEQRRLVTDMARELTRDRIEVLSLYADALIVRSDAALPFLPAPWRIDAHLTNLRFATPTAFMSDEKTKLPGIPRDTLDRWDRIRRIRQPKKTGRNS